MSFFAKMNERLDKGWKLTDVFCPICKGNILASPDLKEYYCLKCDLPARIVPEEIEDQMNTEEEKEISYQKEVPPNKVHRPDPSGKIASKLLQGWTLTEVSCPDCEVTPLVRSKKVGYFCVTCDKTFDFEGNIIPNKQSNMQPPQSSTTKMNPTDTITKPTAAVAKANAVSNIPYSVKLINIAANKLATTKGEGNIDAIFGLLDAQKKIDQSQQELLKLFKRK